MDGASRSTRPILLCQFGAYNNYDADAQVTEILRIPPLVGYYILLWKVNLIFWERILKFIHYRVKG